MANQSSPLTLNSLYRNDERAPPGSPTCLPTSLPTFTTAAPVINATRISATRSTITVNTNFTLPAYYPGIVYCAAFANTSTVIVRNDIIIAMGASGAYAAGQVATKVTITSLSALTHYAVYCAVRTFDGTTSSLVDTRATKHLVETTCCKLLTFTNAPSFVYGSLSKYTAQQTKQYVFSYALSSKPGVKVVITPVVHDSAGNLVSSADLAVRPSWQRFLANSTSQAGSFVMSAPSDIFTGTFVITLVPSGDSATQYRAVNSSVLILAASAPPPTPALLSAKFGDSGGTFDVTFDSSTNKASLPTSFVCSELLSFQGVGSTSCVWSTSSVVRVTFASSSVALVVPGGVVMLAVLIVGAAPLVTNTQYEFTVTVSSLDGRTGSYPVTVQNSPGATLTSINNENVVKIDPRTRLVLSGFITGGYALDASWTASIDGAPLTFEASCPLSQRFTASEVQNTLAYPLSIPGNTFVGGTVVSFRLLAYQSGTAGSFSSYSDVTISMNAPPSGGVLSVTPPSGIALNTSFLSMATSWNDEPGDYPLSYEYTYSLFAAAPELTIQSRTGSNKVTSQLPAGLSSQNEQVVLTCAVFDTYLSASTVSVSVVVSGSLSLDINAYVDSALTSALATGNTNLVSQVIANAASTLNAVNCTNASPGFCAGLNREACYATPQTCSACLEGFMGIIGDSNAPCFNASLTTLNDVGSACTTNAECALNLCSSGVCAAPVLACASDNADTCSGHGQCTYQDGTGKDYGRDCTFLDVICFPVCSCDSAYGGSTCALSENELDSRDITRAKLCNAVLTVNALSDASYLTLNSLVSALYSTYDPFEVFSEASIGVCTDALMMLSDYAAEGYLSEEATSWILQTTSKFIQPLASNSSTTRRLNTHRALVSTDGDVVDAAATAIVAGMLNNLVVGQFASNFASNEMQIIVLKALGSSVSVVTPPATAASITYGTGLTGSIELSSGTAALVQDTGGYVQVAVLMWGSNPFSSSQALVSPLLRLEISALNVSDQEILALNASLGNQPAFYVTLQYSTMQNFNFSLTIDEAMVTGAPNFTVPSCATRVVDGYAHCPCEVTSYSNYNVTFGCGLDALFPVAAGGSRRRAQSEGSSKIVQFGSVLADLDNELIKYLSKNPFEVDLRKSRILLIFLCALSLVILIGYVVFRYWDLVDQKYLVHEKAARDQRHFKNRHAELLAVRMLDHTTSIKAMDWHKDPPNRLADAMSTAFKTHWASPGPTSPSKKRQSAESTDFVDIYTVNSALAEIFDFEVPVARASGGLQISPNAGRKALVTGDSKHNISRGELYRSESTYSVHYDAPQSGLGPGWEREFFVSNSVSHYLTTILPKGSLGDSPGLFQTILRYHKYSAAFVGRSLQHTRVLRWTNVCLGLLVTLFINTLIYGIFYPDEGECQDKLTRDECLSEMSSVYDARLCRWEEDITVIDGGNCSLNPPPQYFVFIIVVVLITVLISLPVQFAYEYLLFTVCFRRPRLEFCGLTGEFWLGPSTQKGELDQSVQSPLKGLHEEAAAKHWTTQRPGNLHRTTSQKFHQEMHPRLEADALLLSVNQALEARIYGENLPWKSVGQTGRSQNLRAIQTRLGIYANGTPVALTGLQWLRYGNRKEELVREIKAVRMNAKKLQAHVDSLDRTDILSEIAGTSFLESLLPAFLDALIVSNYYFYSAAGLFILIPYLVIFAVFLWYYLFRKVRAASYRHNAFFYSSLETDSDAGVSVMENWNTSERRYRTQTRSFFVNIWQSNQKQLQSWWSGEHGKLMHKFDLQWEAMNRPASLQAVESAVSPTSRLKKQQRKSPKEKIASVEAAKAGMRIPNEITDLTVGGSGDWLEVWAESSRSPRPSRGSGSYLTDLMNRTSSHSQPVSSRRFSQSSSAASEEGPQLQLSAPMPQLDDSFGSDRGSFGASFLGTSQRGFNLQRTFSDDRYHLDPVDEDALDSILNNFRFCVESGRMQLVDPEESDALASGTATTCDVLVEFFDLRILLEEHLAQQKPYGRALSADEKSRIVDSCYHWVSGLGDEMLQKHYNQDSAKIAAATLVRRTSSFSPPMSPFSKPFSGSMKAKRERERINFSVPFQEFRRWAQHSGGMLSGINPQDSRNISRRSSKSFGGSVRMELDL
eukprot:gene7530-9027_t